MTHVMTLAESADKPVDEHLTCGRLGSQLPDDYSNLWEVETMYTKIRIIRPFLAQEHVLDKAFA